MIRRLFLFALLPTMTFAQDFPGLVDRFFDEYYFAFQPTAATQAGFHQYDGRLEDYSRAMTATHAPGSINRLDRTM